MIIIIMMMMTIIIIIMMIMIMIMIMIRQCLMRVTLEKLTQWLIRVALDEYKIQN